MDDFFDDTGVEDSNKIKKNLPDLFYNGIDSLSNENVDYIVNKIAEYDYLDGPAIGYGGIRSEQYERFEKLATVKNDSILINLTSHKNAVVRCYAFDALVTRKSLHCLPIFLKHLKDTAGVHTRGGCLGRIGKVNIEFLLALRPEENTYRSWIAFDKSDFVQYSRLLHFDEDHYF
ncbi:MAG: hypothetical protein ACQUYJ_14860 [Ferruginibacter sp.]